MSADILYKHTFFTVSSRCDNANRPLCICPCFSPSLSAPLHVNTLRHTQLIGYYGLTAPYRPVSGFSQQEVWKTAQGKRASSGYWRTNTAFCSRKEYSAGEKTLIFETKCERVWEASWATVSPFSWRFWVILGGGGTTSSPDIQTLNANYSWGWWECH